MDLYEQQALLEQNMSDRGVARFIQGISRHTEAGMEDETFYGKKLVANAAESLAEAIVQWKATSEEGGARRWGTAYPLIRSMDNHVLAVITLRSSLQNISTTVTYTSLVMRLGRKVEDEARLLELENTIHAGRIRRIAEGVRERGNEHYRRFYAKRMAERNIEWINWTDTMHCHVGGILLDLLIATTGLVKTEVQRFQSGRKGIKTVKNVVCDPRVLEWVRHGVEAAKAMSPDYEPMVVPPMEWGVGEVGGYLTNAVRPLKLVKGATAGLEAELAEREMDVVYASLNAIQSTPWKVNKTLLAVMQEAWKLDARLGDCLPTSEGNPLPLRPADIETNPEALREWKNLAFAVHRQNSSRGGKRLAFSRVLDCAERYANYEKLYFPHNLDFRGRVYAVTTLCPQGTDHTKALLQFAEGKALGERGIMWLAIHGANLAGVDKVSYQDRVTWVEDNTPMILACAADPFTNRQWADMDSPWQFLAFCHEWTGVMTEGENYVSHLPVAMDGSCSGIQHFSAMLRDSKGGAAVNLTPQAKPADVYNQVADAVNEKLREAMVSGDDGERTFASEWLRFGVNRKVCKRSVMTLAYGSKQFGFAQQLLEDIVQPAIDGVVSASGFHDTDLDAAPWGNPTAACNYLAKLIWQAVNETLVAAGQAMRWLQAVAGGVAKSGVPVTWTTPVGFLVQQGYQDSRQRQVKLTLGTKRVKIVLREVLDTIDARKQASSVAPNFVHSCDAAHLMLTVARGAQAGIGSFAVIHDSFGTHAADSDTLFRVVREAMVEMYSEVDVITQFRDDAAQQVGEELAAEFPKVPKKGDLDLNLILESAYCFA